MPEREPGTPSAFSDLRGGPSTIRGVEYQIACAARQTLLLLNEARLDPSVTSVVRPELRTLIDAEQFGYDLGWENSPRFPAEQWEIKAAPALADVREFLARLPRLLEEGTRGRSRLVVGARTAAVQDLERLLRLAGEATDVHHLRALVAAAGGLDDLLALVGSDPQPALSRAAQPYVVDQRSQDEVMDVLCTTVALPGQSRRLRAEVEECLREASKSRRVIAMATLAAYLQEARVLRPPELVDTSSEDPRLLAALTVLQRCPAPLPRAALAEGLDISPDELDGMLADHVNLGWVIADHEVVGNAQPDTQPLPPSAGLEDLQWRVLSALYRDSGELDRAPMHVPNVLTLGEACLYQRPHLVAKLFGAFDKASKAYGELGLVQDLAMLSTEAVHNALKVTDAQHEIRELVKLRARNYVCGTAWVLQRVGQLEEARSLMEQARSLSASAGDPVGLAFANKCDGRLARLSAERAEGDEATQLLIDSEGLLRRAAEAFRSFIKKDLTWQEDLGECYSLLGRTHTVAGDLTRARQACAEAHTHLDLFPGGKALADLTLLEAEIALREYEIRTAEGRADVEALEEHLARASSVAGEHDPAKPHYRRSTSEIAARAHRIIARLHVALGARDVAAGHYAQAEQLYLALDYFDAACEARWEAIQLGGPSGLPPELTDALVRRGADAATGVMAYEECCRRFSPGGATADARTSFPANDRSWWDAMVEQAATRAIARRPRWGEARSTA